MNRQRPARVTRRLLMLLAAVTVALGLSIGTGTPALAAYNRSFSVGGDAGSAWGTVTFTGKWSYTVDGYIWRESGMSAELRVCYYHWEEGYWWHWDGCTSASGGNVNSTRHVTLSKPSHFASIGMVTAQFWSGGVQSTSQTIYNPYVVTGT